MGERSSQEEHACLPSTPAAANHCCQALATTHSPASHMLASAACIASLPQLQHHWGAPAWRLPAIVHAGQVMQVCHRAGECHELDCVAGCRRRLCVFGAPEWQAERWGREAYRGKSLGSTQV